MTKKLSVSIFLLLIGLSCLVLVVEAQTLCPSACTCMLPSEAAKMKGYSLCGGKQVICSYDKAQNPMYCYQKPATVTLTATKTLTPTPTPIQTAVVPTSPISCPSTCSCLVPADANKMGYFLCGGKQSLCEYDQYQNPQYCYQKPITTATPTKPPVTQTEVVTVSPASCPSTCVCMVSTDANKIGYTLCGGKQSLCGYDKYQNPQYCYQKPITTETPTKPSATITAMVTSPPSKCVTGCLCLRPGDAKAEGYPYCNGKQTICGYDKDNSPLYCFSPPAAPTTPLSSPEGTTTPEVITTFQPPAETAQISGIPATVMESSVTQQPRIISSIESIPQTPLATAPMQGPGHQEIERGGLRGIMDAIVNFFSSLFGRSEPPSSTPSQRVVCNGILTDLMADPENCGECGIVCPSGQCTMGVCRDVSGLLTTCQPFQALCEGTCIDILIDERNCGSCGNSCPILQDCCNGICTDHRTDDRNCGRCGVKCSLGERCCNSGCRNTSSDDWYCGSCENSCPVFSKCCNGICIDTENDETNCGNCGFPCRAGEICSFGRCINLDEDERNCGTIGHSCIDIEKCCSGECKNIKDEMNCGECGVTCAPGETCCDGHCVDFQEDSHNCGWCGHRCDIIDEICCNGTCVNSQNDNSNCGGCGITCCGYACNPRETFCCSGSCRNLQTDENYCGSCSIQCLPDEICYYSVESTRSYCCPREMRDRIRLGMTRCMTREEEERYDECLERRLRGEITHEELLACLD